MIKKLISTVTFCALAIAAMAQKPHYVPGDGVYIVGIPADMSPTYEYPVMVTESYKATFKTTGAKLAAATAGEKSFNISSNIQEDGTLDLVRFLGTGTATNLVVRNFMGQAYSIGDYCPTKNWDTTYLVAAVKPWDDNTVYNLGVYDHWDCPVSYAEDEMITKQKMDKVRIDFGNPHEGLVCFGVNFNLVSESADLKTLAPALKVTLSAWDETRTMVVGQDVTALKAMNVAKVSETEDGKTIYSVYVSFRTPFILEQPFTIDVEGFSKLGVDAWIPRAVDTHNLYPTHTTYINGTTTQQVAAVDACVNIEGYFNYVGTWGWYDGKCEYGEVVGQGDYVQVYYDPSDPDWPGDFFMGDPTFPIECAFGIEDLVIEYLPDWITGIQVDQSQWAEYEALLIIMVADPMPQGMSGRYDKVVISTSDGASKYTIHIRQGDAQYPMGIKEHVVNIPAAGGAFDLSGRKVNNMKKGSLYIQNGKKFINK